MSKAIVEVEDLVKDYGELHAVQNIRFQIEEGEIFGLLGPNGAGKSTTISMLTCLFPPTSGSIRVQGLDVVKDAMEVKKNIGVVPQDLALYPTLNARDNLGFFGEMFGLRGKLLQQRIKNVLEIVAMTERANDPIRTYSGGMKRRINLAVGLINDPKILFLDEPTVGVDPQSRNHIFESIQKLNGERGMSILYTTHYMEEAERLCSRVAIIDKGKIIAQDTPKNLIALLGKGVIRFGLAQGDEELRKAVEGLGAVKSATFIPLPPKEDGSRVTQILKVEVHSSNEAMIQVIQLFHQHNIELLTIEALEPNLESVFLHLTGKSLRE